MSRDLPVLTAVVELCEEHFPATSSVGRLEVAERSGLENEDIDRAVAALVGDGYLDWVTNPGDDRIVSWRVTGVSGRARRLVGQWPSADGLIVEMVSALNVAAENEPDAEKGSKLRDVARGMNSVAKGVITSVAANLITGGIT